MAAPPPDGSVDSGTAADEVFPIDSSWKGRTGAVIIPAHDESHVIRRTLRQLDPLASDTGIEVIVVCNGCSDDTAAVAREFRHIRVEDIPDASKTTALNLGDRIATSWPRLYLDADIEIAPESVLAVFEALGQPGTLAARANYVYDTSGATAPVQAYYRARTRIQAPTTRLWGAGGYATNEQGHVRLPEFPHVTSDDCWFDALFDDSEKRVVTTTPMRVRTPLDSAALLAVLTRQRRGHVELGGPSSAGARAVSLLESVRGPGSLVDLIWYVALTGVARFRSMRTLRRSDRAWERDASSRTRIGAAS